jgi:hypothetical protein
VAGVLQVAGNAIHKRRILVMPVAQKNFHLPAPARTL